MYKTLIEKPGEQVLLPVIFYIDAANTGQFADLPVTAVNFSLRISTRKPERRTIAGEFWAIYQLLQSTSQKASILC